VVGRTGRGDIVVNLRPGGMRPCHRSSQCDTAARNLCAGSVRMSERRDDCDRGGTKRSGGGNNCSLRVPASIDRDGLAVTKTNRAGDRDYGSAGVGGGADRGGAGRANRRDDTSLDVRACINRDLLSNIRPCTLATLRLVAPASEGAARVVAAWVWKSVQLLSLSAPSGKRPALSLIAPAVPAAGPKPPAGPGAGT